MMRARTLVWLACGAGLVVGLPLMGKWARRHEPPRCELNGLPIQPLYRVRVVDRAGASHEFCCASCAERWLARQGEPPATVFVTDEASGAELEAPSAWFVASAVTTNPITGNRLHAFRDRSAAEEHARTFGGELLTGAERPFQ